MCTVTFVPLGKNEFILTSNRDEDPNRVTLDPENLTTIKDNGFIVSPRDSKAGGSWIGMSEDGKVACLLNGAFVKHHHNPPYSRSRGLVLMEYFSSKSAMDFHNRVDLNGVENFTLLMLENNRVYEFRWDGEEKFFDIKDEREPHIWSSCTLYDAATSAQKETRFLNWFDEQKEFSDDKMASFHGFKNPPGFLLELPMVKTVSITTIHKNAEELTMKYHDLLTYHDVTKTIEL